MCLVGGEPEGRRPFSGAFEREAGVSERRVSTCIRSSRSRSAAAALGGEGAVDAGESVAMGGRAMGPVFPLMDASPAPMGRGCGGSTAGRGGLGG